jgi:hypothetical protein
MNIAEIESELQDLADKPFDPASFIFHFLEIYDAPKANRNEAQAGFRQSRPQVWRCFVEEQDFLPRSRQWADRQRRRYHADRVGHQEGTTRAFYSQPTELMFIAVTGSSIRQSMSSW